MSETLFWYDYETSGLDPKYDRVYQFAGLRTDLDLNPVDDPVNLLCHPGSDTLPSPEACLVTGLLPQDLVESGMKEADFCRHIVTEFSKAETCTLGYNSIRFDDEFTRFTLYRNLYDPYAREWQNGNSRWDILGLVQLAYALRPDGINWPVNQAGKTSLKLEDLSKANSLSHLKAHDAMSDVHATIELARLIRKEQPRLYDYVFNHRKKQAVSDLLWDSTFPAVIYCTSMVKREQKHLAFVKPLFTQSENRNSVVAFDLRYDPALLAGQSPDALKDALINKKPDSKLSALKSALHYISINRCPVVVPLNTISEQQLKEFKLDRTVLAQRAAFFDKQRGLVDDLKLICVQSSDKQDLDADAALYSGGFIANDDRERMRSVHELEPGQLAQQTIIFDDKRLNELLFRYRARNYSDTLTSEEIERWNTVRRERLLPGVELSEVKYSGVALSWEKFETRINSLLSQDELSEEKRVFLKAIQQYGQTLVSDLR